MPPRLGESLGEAATMAQIGQTWMHAGIVWELLAEVVLSISARARRAGIISTHPPIDFPWWISTGNAILAT